MNGELQLTKAIRNKAPQYDIPGGMLYPFNGGEFGSTLYYKPNDPAQKEFLINGKPSVVTNAVPAFVDFFRNRDISLDQRYVGALMLKSAQVYTVMPYKDSLYMIESYSHMGTNNGMIVNISLKGNAFTYHDVLSFTDENPQTVSIFKDHWLVATNKTLYKIINWKKEPVIENAFWQILFPNSIAVKSENEVYMGMSGGYVKINIPKKKLTFYKYKE